MVDIVKEDFDLSIMIFFKFDLMLFKQK